MERGWKPNVEISPPCPRCGSCNTKFCYYNNYSLTQPRYFCKGCRRYWTKGGSLRNVPVGGGCRRSRRGKSIRISTDRVPSRSLADGGALGHNIGTSSSMVSEGPNIDLALVYANFLNQQPESSAETRIEMPQQLGSGVIDPSFEFAGVVDMQHMEFSTHHLLLENEVVECPNLSDLSLATHLSNSNGNGNGMYGCGFNSIHNQQETLIQQFSSSNIIHTSNYGLPPLPGEEEEVVVSDQEMAWSNNPQMMNSSHMLHVAQPPPIQSEAQDPDQLNIGDRASYQLSSYGTFFVP